MSIIDGTGLVVWEGGLFLPGSDLLRRVQWAFAQIRAAGGTIILNEAGRPFGVPGDANVGNAWQTASGRSTVWFQWGRYLRGETPTAADPRSGNVLASEHTQGIATDTNAPTIFDMTLRAQFFRQAGMVQTIPSESWHFAIRGNPLVDLGSSVAGIGSTPIVPVKRRPTSHQPFTEEDDMSQPIIARGDKLDVWYALYNRVIDSTADIEQAPDKTYVSTQSSGPVYFGRRLVGPGERAAIEAFKAQTGFLLPDSNQKDVVVMSQATFDQINKIAGSDYSR